ncbi:MAG: hypothetical protein CRN43_07055 [Candidatus Nephrothrix sp. EaCA]|nr:MAG: hypothetical protein CRN43_07055 [Candidatus Nephrothrix sp. EaCA]
MDSQKGEINPSAFSARGDTFREPGRGMSYELWDRGHESGVISYDYSRFKIKIGFKIILGYNIN